MACTVRAAWLTLGALTVALENQAGGWFCQSLDLGSPDVREVIGPRPDADGMIDRTQNMGARIVSADVMAVAGAGAQLDAVAASFAPFMVPAARPVLHFVLDRPGAAERTLVLRGMSFASAIAGGASRAIQLQWKAADPVVRDPATHTVVALSGVTAGTGRGYPLVFSRTYPAGGGSPSTATIASPGDVTVRPLLAIYGPVTGPVVTFDPTSSTANMTVAFVPSFRIDAGHYVLVDTAAQTAFLDGPAGTSVLAWLDWFNTVWPTLPTLPDTTTMSITGGSTSGLTQVQASWQDGYLT